MTKCVVSQLRNGQTVSQPTISSHTARITSYDDGLGGAPVLFLDDRSAERGDGRADDQRQRRADEPLPVRVAVQHHPLVGGQHVIRVTHDRKLYGSIAAQMGDIARRHRQRRRHRCRCAACPGRRRRRQRPRPCGRRAGWRAPGSRSSRCATGSRRPARRRRRLRRARRRSWPPDASGRPRRRRRGRPSRRASYSDVATGSGASVTLRPSPTTTTGCGEATSARMPASFPVPTSTSLGHFSPALMPATSATASTTATPVSSGSQPHASPATSPTPTPTESATCDRGGVDQLLPCLPRPEVWDSAISTAPSMSSPAAARASRSALVDPVSVDDVDASPRSAFHRMSVCR